MLTRREENELRAQREAVYNRKVRCEQLLNSMKTEVCKSPFEESMIDLLELIMQDVYCHTMSPPFKTYESSCALDSKE
jgi:hypothetical protein